MPTHDATLEDLHVHSTFSDGRDSLMANVARASALGLRRLGCVDHVRADTDWVPDFVREVQRVARQTSVELVCGVEAKLLDEAGTLDVPSSLRGVDYIYAADHRIPLGSEALSPKEVRGRMERGTLRGIDVVDALTRATLGAMERYERVVVAHLFSSLPKVGLTEADVPDANLHILACAAAENGVVVEIDERWRSPAPRTVSVFLQYGVEVVLSSDAHRRDHIARYDYAPWALDLAHGESPPADGRGAYRMASHAKVA